MKPVQPEHRDLFEDLKRVRAEALDHARIARDLSGRRADLIRELTRIGYAQADIARELGVSRQAVQKMVASG
jgi:DNA-binding NarL/FixJ family response regulator